MEVTVCLSEPHKRWRWLSLTSACYTGQVMAALPSRLEMSLYHLHNTGLCLRSLMYLPGPSRAIPPWHGEALRSLGWEMEDEGLLFHSGP